MSIEINNLPQSWYERDLLLSLLPPTTIDVKVLTLQHLKALIQRNTYVHSTESFKYCFYCFNMYALYYDRADI